MSKTKEQTRQKQTHRHREHTGGRGAGWQKRGGTESINFRYKTGQGIESSAQERGNNMALTVYVTATDPAGDHVVRCMNADSPCCAPDTNIRLYVGYNVKSF